MELLTPSEKETAIREAVARGVAWLDQTTARDWRAEVRESPRFEIWSSCDCVLGTLFGDCWRFLGETDRDTGWAEEHGFTLPAAPSGSAWWDFLQALWDDEIGRER